jgi:hypothetical protein
MKKRLNVIVLVFEIAAITVLHAIKINQSGKRVDDRIHASIYSSLKQPVKASLPIILINVK